MKVGISSAGDWSRTTAWLNRAGKKVPRASLNRIGAQGDKALAAGTPVDTGATAAGWSHKVVGTSSGAELYWYNNARPGLSVNIALLLNYGHGTGTGGYVPPFNYIRPAITRVLDGSLDSIFKEMME